MKNTESPTTDLKNNQCCERLKGCTFKKVLIGVIVGGTVALIYIVSQMYPPFQLSQAASFLSTSNLHLFFLKSNSTIKNEEEDYLLSVLESRLKRFAGERHNLTKLPDCLSLNGKQLSHACIDNQCQAKFSASPRERLRQILRTRTALPEEYRQALASATERVKPHQYVFLSGASSNHLPQTQAMMKTMIANLFPAMKGKNFTFVFYDFGLSSTERRLTELNCNCTVLDFPFKKFPEFVSNMFCYSWKPLTIASLINKAEYLIWMDASVRWGANINLDDLFSRAKERGFQMRYEKRGTISARTVHTMAEYFGDSLCQYSSYLEFGASFGVYYNNRFMRKAILQPWVSCALNRTCMCVENYQDLQRCRRRFKGGKRRFSMCHRFDQSALGFIWSKLLLHHRAIIEMPWERRSLAVFKLARHYGMNWFLSENETDAKKPDFRVFHVET